MWRHVDVRNFRSIEEVSVDLAPFTLLVGPNGSGKSNFVDAIVFARDVGIDAAGAIERRRGILSLRRWQPTKLGEVTVDVRAAKTRAELSSDYGRHLITIASERGHRWSFRRELIEACSRGRLQFQLDRSGRQIVHAFPPELPSIELSGVASAMLFARQLKMPKKKSRALTDVRSYRLDPEVMRRLSVPTESDRLDSSGANIATAVQSVCEDRDDRGSLVSAMKKIIPGLEEISVEPVDDFLSLKFAQAQANGKKARFNAHDMSEGALRALGILVAALQMQDDELLIIEEPEVSIHPGAAHLLFDVLKRASQRGAVLVTTHSPDLLDAAGCGDEEEILVCDYREGTTHVGPMAETQREIVRKGLFTVGELMRAEPLRIEGAPPAIIVPETDIARVRARSKSFDKLCRAVEALASG
jgi:type I restriction enzyme M protein